MGRTAKNPNAHLLYGVARAYGGWRVAEVAAVSLDRLRVMQRPRLMKTRGAAAAAELGFWGVERRKTMEREE